MLERVWRKGNPLTLLVGIQTSTATMETVWRFLKKLEIELPYDPAIPLLGIHTEETKSERDTCIPMFIAALFIVARTWKQPRCPSADEWIRKLWYIYTMEYYSAIKKNIYFEVYSILGLSSGSGIKNLPANVGDTGLILGSGRSPEEGNGNPL